MKNARLETSPRLQRVAAVLSDGLWHSTLEIIECASVCAVNSIISELRENGCQIDCEIRTVGGQRIWEYRLTGFPDHLGRHFEPRQLRLIA